MLTVTKCCNHDQHHSLYKTRLFEVSKSCNCTKKTGHITFSNEACIYCKQCSDLTFFSVSLSLKVQKEKECCNLKMSNDTMLIKYRSCFNILFVCRVFNFFFIGIHIMKYIKYSLIL